MIQKIAFCSNDANPFYDAVLRGVLEQGKLEEVEILSWLGSYRFPLAALKYLKADGLLLGAVEKGDLKEEDLATPHLGYSNRFQDGIRPAVVNDDQEAGKMAVRELASSGYHQVALLSQPELWHAHLRIEGAREQAGAFGMEVFELNMTLRGMNQGETFQDVWHEHQHAFRRFLQQLPENTALIATGNGHAQDAIHILEEELGRKVPEDVGLVLVDLSDQQGGLLATVRLNGEEVGRRLVQRLVCRLNGETDSAPELEKIAPHGFLQGKSLRQTEAQKLYSRVNQWCTENLRESVTVKELCRSVGLSRRSLELKLKDAGLPPPYEILTRIRLENAKHLLREGGIRIGDVAERSGFRDARALRKRFQAYTGMSPRDWAKQEG